MRERYLLDSCVVVRWFVQQAGWKASQELRDRFLAGEADIQTIDVVRFEVGNVLRKVGLLPKLLAFDEYVAAVRAVDDLGVPIHVTTADVLERAATIAAKRNINFFDAVFVAWSFELDITLLTTDARLYRATDGFARVELVLGSQP